MGQAASESLSLCGLTPARLEGDGNRMGCKQCQKNRERALARRKQLRDAKVARLTKGCDAGDANACRTLRSLLGSEKYDRENKFRSELHRRG